MLSEQQRYDLWATAVKQLTNQSIFQVVQFITNPQTVTYGGQLQKLTCESIGVPQDSQELFWAEVGSRALEEAIRRKRGTLLNAMKERFVRYTKEETVPPPDPKKILPEGTNEDGK